MIVVCGNVECMFYVKAVAMEREGTQIGLRMLHEIR